MDRKKFLTSTALLAFSVSMFGKVIPNKDESFRGDCETTNDILGPFYRPNAPTRQDLTHKELKGQRVTLKGKVFGNDCITPLKNALVEDNDEKAAEAGMSLATAFKGLDKSSLAADQTTKFDEIIESATEHAEHISENKGNIVHQREHLALLSKDVKDLVGIMGTDRTLYAEFCPMYDNNKGAMWLSASKEIKNPYFGSKMLSCGKVQEEITVK